MRVQPNRTDAVSVAAGFLAWGFAGFLKITQPATSDILMYVLIAVGGVFINPYRLPALLRAWRGAGRPTDHSDGPSSP